MTSPETSTDILDTYGPLKGLLRGLTPLIYLRVRPGDQIETVLALNKRFKTRYVDNLYPSLTQVQAAWYDEAHRHVTAIQAIGVELADIKAYEAQVREYAETRLRDNRIVGSVVLVGGRQALDMIPRTLRQYVYPVNHHGTIVHSMGSEAEDMQPFGEVAARELFEQFLTNLPLKGKVTYSFEPVVPAFARLSPLMAQTALNVAMIRYKDQDRETFWDRLRDPAFLQTLAHVAEEFALRWNRIA